MKKKGWPWLLRFRTSGLAFAIADRWEWLNRLFSIIEPEHQDEIWVIRPYKWME